MKSDIQYLQGLYSAMFFDIAVYFPHLQVDCRRDASRLLSLIDQRGLPFLMVDLPAFGKHLDRCMADGSLTTSGIAGFRPYRSGGVIPRLFKGLLLQIFDDNGVLRIDYDPAAIRFSRQLCLMAKKYKIACSDSRTWEHVHEFFKIDHEVRSSSLNWDEDELRTDSLRNLHIGDSYSCRPAPLFDHITDIDRSRGSFSTSDSSLADTVQRTADACVSVFGGFNPSEWRSKHGPGAVSDQRRTSFKYDFPTWSAKLEGTFPSDELAFANFSFWVDFLSGQGSSSSLSENEPPSRLIAVPKTLKGPRLIASEPVSHQWCQQSIRDFLTVQMRKSPLGDCIMIHDQKPNQRLALEASHTGSHATIDLSSASDRISCWLVERIFRANSSLLSALHASRTRWIANAIDKKSPAFHKIRKFSCMGSACTFPVQSVIFAILAISTILHRRNIPISIRNIRQASKEVQVYGDDIIVPIDCWEVLQGLLGDLGLEVNRAKTYGNGKFRESCGVDAYDGHDVSATYSITFPEVSRPESMISLVDTHNNFLTKGYWRTAEYLKSTVEGVRNYRIPSVPIGSGCFGWWSFDGFEPAGFKTRWNEDYHRMEVQVDKLYAKSIRLPNESGGQLLQYFTEALPVAYILGDRIGTADRPTLSIKRRWEPKSLLES